MATQTFVNDLQAMNPANVPQNTAKSPVVTQAQVVQQQQLQQQQQQQQQLQQQQQQPNQVQAPQQQASVQQLTQQPQTSAVNAGPIQKVQVSQATTTILQPAHTGHSYIVATSVPESTAEQVHEQASIQQPGQTVYSAHVQYVEANDQAIYSAANGQMSGYQEYTPNAMYSSVGGTYYQTTGSQMATNIAHVQSIQGQIITQHAGTYVIQSSTMDGEGAPLSHTTRASPATVQWLLDNYETAEGVSLPRSTLYNHYLRHCQEQNLDPMNPASFGKLIRSVFIGLRTRRLGTRGNSKYHYYGIRIKANSPLNQFTDEQTMALRQQPIYHGKKMRFANNKVEENEGMYSHYNSGHQDSSQTQQQHHQQFLGDASGAIPNFVEVDTSLMPLHDGIMMDHIRTFEKIYREHAEAIVDAVVNLQFSLIEALWQGFWRNQTLEQQQSTDNNYEKRLPKDKLYTMCKYEPLQKYVQRSDYAFYQALVEVLIPDVLRPIPSSLTQAIRNFAKSLENWLKGAMHGVPDEMVKTKVGAVSAFAQTLRRYTSLNHLAQAARAVLQNTSQINQMLTDLNRVDFANVQEQASWVCQCEDAMVHQLEQDFKKTLQSQNSLEQWAVWLEGVVNQILKPHEGSANFPKAARQFLLKWSFYSSMVIRDLTLRSAASFGSFHLIRLLYDEYMFYLVEHKVAAATDETPIAVMGKVRQFIDLGNAAALNSLDSCSVSIAAGVKPSYIPHNTVINSSGNGHAVDSVTTSTNAATTTVMVLTPAISHTGNISTTAQTNPISNTHQVSLRATPATTQLPAGQKTIVVMPVSTVGAGEVYPMKRMKTE